MSLLICICKADGISCWALHVTSLHCLAPLAWDPHRWLRSHQLKRLFCHPHIPILRDLEKSKIVLILGEIRRIRMNCSAATYYWMDPATSCLFLQILASWPLDFLAISQIKTCLARISRSDIAYLSTFPISSDVPRCLVFFLLFNDRVISSSSIFAARLPSLEKLKGWKSKKLYWTSKLKETTILFRCHISRYLLYEGFIFLSITV